MSTSSVDANSRAIPTTAIIAEAVGTALLVLIGPGTAIFAADAVGAQGVALAFGFALMFAAYAIGHVSGCHINPAVTLGFLLAKKIDTMRAAYYMAAQVVGALVGGLLLYIATETGDLDATGVFAANGWGDEIGSRFGLGSVVIVEIVFTAILVFVVLSTITKGYPTGFGGLAAGVTLAAIHLATIPVDNTSVNPARSLGVVFFAGGDHIAQIWAFIIFPLIGGAVGYGMWVLVHPDGAD
jgi:aquaporin Z